MITGWPATLRDDSVRASVVLRPLKRSDAKSWVELRARNADWLEPWEASQPNPIGSYPLSFGAYVRGLNSQGRAGATLSFAVLVDDELVGQVSLSTIVWGSMCSGNLGYWVSEHVAGRGVIPTAVALVIDHCFAAVGLHRIEINIRPENDRSLRVVEKLGLRDEGLRERFLHIDGDWRDHRAFAVTAEEVPRGLLGRWQRERGF